MSKKSVQFSCHGAEDIKNLCGGFSEVDEGEDDSEEDDEQGAQE